MMVTVPTSALGRLYGAGEVVAKWGGSIAVIFTDDKGRKHRGHYTISKHDIRPS